MVKPTKKKAAAGRGAFGLASDHDIKKRLKAMEDRIMEAIQQFGARVKASFTELGTKVDGLVVSLDGVTEDVTFLKDKIAELQNSPGTLNAEDQALLDEIVELADGLVTKTSTTAAKLAELDAATEKPITPNP